MHVLFPTDFSEASINSLAYAKDVCSRGDYQLVVISAYDLPYSERSFNSMSLLEAIEENAKSNMSAFEEKHLQGLPFESSTKLVVGNPVTAIKEACNDQTAMIVMGTKGSSGLEEVLIGSNAGSVIKGVKKPVLIVPPSAAFSPLKKLLFCSELEREEDDGTLQSLKQFALLYKAEINILHIQDEDGSTGGRALFEEHFKDIPHHYTVMSAENIEEAILNHAQEAQVDVIASMTKKRGFFEGLFHKSLTNKLAFHTKMPLLALHQH